MRAAAAATDPVRIGVKRLVMFLVFMTLLFIWRKPLGFPFSAGAPTATAWTVLTVCVYTMHQRLSSWSSSSSSSSSTSTPPTTLLVWTRGALFLLLAVAVPVFFEASNVVMRYLYTTHGAGMLYDTQLLAMDTALLGAFFPRGQLTLYLDGNDAVGTTSTIGPLYTEVLQVLYASYYLWGNGLGVYVAYMYFKHARCRATAKPYHWRRVQMFLTAWTGAFLFNFLLNMLVPAVSPRIFLKDEYHTEIRGLYLANAIRGALKSAAANSFSAFPSGHCGMSWLTALLAHRMGFATYARVTAVVAALITTATLVLRYHYFVDFAFSPTVIVFGAWLGGFLSQQQYATRLHGDGNISTDVQLLPTSSKTSSNRGRRGSRDGGTRGGRRAVGDGRGEELHGLLIGRAV